MTSFNMTKPNNSNDWQPSLKVGGQAYHLIGPLEPEPNVEPKCMQIYFMDSEQQQTDAIYLIYVIYLTKRWWGNFDIRTSLFGNINFSIHFFHSPTELGTVLDHAAGGPPGSKRTIYCEKMLTILSIKLSIYESFLHRY